jgi:hypothetical protein
MRFMVLADHCELTNRPRYATTIPGSIGKRNDQREIRKRPECIPMQE